jgi:hypothetical protein
MRKRTSAVSEVASIRRDNDESAQKTAAQEQAEMQTETPTEETEPDYDTAVQRILAQRGVTNAA